ncbi:hypothetical protein FKP32DRAFT_1572511 [Trametes sanguinea]|nr:hypothetical protein FKP32DRAFT_1572511 [Trametes sanguinea]
MAENGSTSTTIPSQDLRSNELNPVVEACTKAVDDYRNGTISKTEALFIIAEQLRGNTEADEDSSSDAALQSYINMLREIDRLRGRGGGSSDGGGDAAGSDNSVSGDASVTERPAKRGRVDSNQYAWAADEFILEPRLRPEVQRTLDLIRVYGEDVTQARRDLAATASAPEFPDSEWSNVLLGRAVDLDHVFAGQYTSAIDDKISEKIGDLELRYKPPVPAKRIRSFGDWVFAWGRATSAIAFAFPHRRAELVSYGEHIIALFGALAEPLHGRVLDYDRAVRKRVGSARRFLLTDFGDFADLKIQYLDSGGANVFKAESTGSSSGGPRVNSRRQKEACRNWNRGECHYKASECRYRHVCSFCSAEGHSRPQCHKAQKRSA